MVATSSTLLAQAGERTGLDSWGDDAFLEGLEHLCSALEAEAALSDLGVLAVEEQVVASLANRLRVTAWVADNPELDAARVERPLVVLGLPRTGTTLLHELLHRDPANRSLMRWEASDSVPPPDAATFRTDPRIDAARAASAAMDALNPDLRAIQYEAPDGPTECVTVLAQAFASLLWSVVANVPSYTEQLLDADAGPVYRYHHRVLQLLQSHTGGRWALKTPHHALFLDALVAEYPDARLVMTHRDPVTVVASLCSLARCLGGTFSDRDHTADVARTWTDVAETLVRRVIDFRDRRTDVPFADVGYDELVADPVGTTEQVLAQLGEPLSAPARAGMLEHLAEDPHRAAGHHRYGLADTGLDAGRLSERFHFYTKRFDVPTEGPRP